MALWGPMSTLAEIESAVSSLPPSQQESLLLWLQSRMSGTSVMEGKANSARQEWLQRRAVRRERGRTDRAGTPLQQIMDELRGA